MEIIKKVHHESVLLKHLLDENGAEVFEDALQSLQQSILELIEAKAGILLSDDILGESYWSEFYELLTKSVQNLEDIKERNNQQVQPPTQATIYNENPFLSNNQTNRLNNSLYFHCYLLQIQIKNKTKVIL